MNTVESAFSTLPRRQIDTMKPLDLHYNTNPIASGAATPAVEAALAEATEIRALALLRAFARSHTGSALHPGLNGGPLVSSDVPLSFTNLLGLVTDPSV